MPSPNADRWAPKGAPAPVVKPGEFTFATAFMDHGHIWGQAEGLVQAGATCKWIWDPDAERMRAFVQKFPGVRMARSYDEILDDPEVQLVAAAAIPCERAGIGFRTMRAGKDYFTDKAPFTSLDQLSEARRVVEETGRKYACYFSERLHSEAGWHVGEMLRGGAIGKVLQVLNLAPHRLGKSGRPAWFFDKARYGGILTDIGSHQFEQFLSYAGAADATVEFARVDNFANADTPEFEDFGEASLRLDTGASAYLRVDWFTPDGHRSWGDGRCFVLGTEGFIEVRKYNDLTIEPINTDVIYHVDQHGETRIPCAGRVGFPYFGRLIRDVIERTETAMTQAHCFKAAELSLKAQVIADQGR